MRIPKPSPTTSITKGDSNSPERTVTVSYVRLLTDYCQLQGLSESELLSHAHISYTLDINAEDARIPFSDFMRLGEQAQRLLNDDDLGLKVGQTIRPGHYGIHGHAVMSARTLGECLDRSIRYHSLVHNGGKNLLVREGERALMCYQCNMPELNDLGRFQNELCLSAWTAFARWVTGLSDYSATWMSFIHACPTHTALHDTLFRCPIQFNATRNAIAFPAEFLNVPNPQANPTVVRIMDELSERSLMILKTNDEPEWLLHARHHIAQNLQHGLPTLEELASALGMSGSEMRNTLKKQRMLFTELLENTRRTLALSYLRDPALSLADISYMLGFSEQSAFTRAFKRWTGTSPGQHRHAKTSRDPN